MTVIETWEQRQARMDRAKARKKMWAKIGRRVGIGTGTATALSAVYLIGSGLWIWLGVWALWIPVGLVLGFVTLYALGMGVDRMWAAWRARL